MESFEYECLFFELEDYAITDMKEREGFNSYKKIHINHTKMNPLQKLWIFFRISRIFETSMYVYVIFSAIN